MNRTEAAEILKPCPFCGATLRIRHSVNAYGQCETEGCWMNARKVIVPLDDPRQVSGWNTRALEAPDGWHDGAPPHPWKTEWFIAETTYGDRVVLRALPKEYTFDFKTADETYIMQDKVRRWMQFPDSMFQPYRAMVAAAPAGAST